VQTLLQTIAREKRNLEGAKAVMRAVEQSSKNEAVIQHAQNEVRAAQESIQYLEGELSKLSLGSSGGGSPAGTPTKGESSSSGRGGYQGMMPTPGRGGPMGPGAMSPSPSRGSLADSRDRPLPPPPTAPGAGPEDVMRRPEQKNYTQLGESCRDVGVGLALTLQICYATTHLSPEPRSPRCSTSCSSSSRSRSSTSSA
jgi:classical protein kinase C/novel protein kinase C epsilon type